jgi:transglutaminase-like putative cysteine protease
VERWRKRTRNSVRQALGRGDHLTMLTVWAMLIVVALGLHASDWGQGMWSLVLVSFLAASLGYFLAWSNLSEGTALLVSSAYGLAVVAVIGVLVLATGPDLAARATDFVTRVRQSLAAPPAESENPDTLLLVLFWGIFFWFVAHNTVWHIFRIDRVWRAVLPPGLLLMFRAGTYDGDAPLEVFIIIYVLLALILVVRSHADAREYEWYRNQVRYTRSMRQYFLRVGAGLSLCLVLLAWIIPTGGDRQVDDRLEKFFQDINAFADFLEQLFSPIESEGVASADYYGGDQLDLGGAISLGEDVVLEVEAPTNAPRYYWRSTVFDTYSNGSWSHGRAVRATKNDGGLRLNIGAANQRQTITQIVTVRQQASSLIYAAPQPTFFDVPVRVELDCVNDLLQTACVNDNQEVDMSISRTLDPIRQGESYRVESSISTASADMLRGAGQEYPAWVSQRYLQGGDQVTPRLRQLTLEIIANAGAATAYDKAKALERWLRQNITYNENIPTPPANQDPVDWVVFDWREGYCNYYASAMILMLRSEGIPARMAAGFSQGEYDPSLNRFIVREREAHTWVEVYFPGYGWINFEPTANEESLDRDGDSAPEQNMPTFTPVPTQTPSPEPSMTPSPLPQDGGAPSPTPQEQNIIFTATPTPTPTPSPTPTAFVPAPEQQETTIESQENSSILGLLLAILAGLVLFTLLLVLLALFIVWWVEHRGLGGLSMTEKAYARLAIYARFLGMALPPEHTPEERRQVLVEGVPEGEPPINDITRFYVESHYAPPNRAGYEGEAEQAWSEARRAFLRQKMRQWLGRG